MIFIVFIIFILINCSILTILNQQNILAISLLIAYNEIFIFIIFKEIISIYLFKRKYQKINYDDENKFIYFRELLTEYSISELGIIYNNLISSKVLIALELINLIKLNKIKIDNNNLIIFNKENLNYNQNYLLETIKFIDTTEFQKTYKRKVKNHLIKKSLFNKYSRELDFKTIFIFVISFIFTYTFSLGVENILPIILISFLLLWFELGITMIFLSIYSISIRTKKGQEIYLKLIGLKRYLNDFNKFDEKHLKEIELWGDYILYAVILNESSKIKKETLEQFERIINIIKNRKIEEKNENKLL